MTDFAAPTIIAIPARNEVQTIAACLDALRHQCDLNQVPLRPETFEIALTVNNTIDATVDTARAFAQAHRMRLKARTIELSPQNAHAGGARRAAMNWALDLLGPAGGWICTTDADSRPNPDWLAQIWACADQGVDAVAGVIEFAGQQIPARRQFEEEYASLQAHIDACLDEDALNPWPNHIWAWGANLAVKSQAYQSVGGVPEVSLAEDRALVAALKASGHRVRHSMAARVVTSSRRCGRAPGGLADLLAAYDKSDDEGPCDAALEPIRHVARRARLRRRIRALHLDNAVEATPRIARRLKVDPKWLDKAWRQASFSRFWSDLEGASPVIASRRLWPHQLPTEMTRAKRLLDQFRCWERKA